MPKTDLKINTSYVGETIEQKINRIVNNKEPIKDGAPLIYTDRKDGVIEQYDIRTDRWEVAITEADRVQKAKIAARDKRATDKEMAKQAREGMRREGDGGAETVQATGN